jgi:hypothetical protein
MGSAALARRVSSEGLSAVRATAVGN